VVHYCVPNMTANTARTASRALSDAVLAPLREMTDNGVEAALRADPGLAAGLYLYKGELVNDQLAAIMDLPSTPLNDLMAGEGRS